MHEYSFLPPNMYSALAIEFCTVTMRRFSTPLYWIPEPGSESFMDMCTDIAFSRSPWPVLNGVAYECAEPPGAWPVLIACNVFPSLAPDKPSQHWGDFTISGLLQLSCKHCGKYSLQTSPNSSGSLDPWFLSLTCSACGHPLWPWTLTGSDTVSVPDNVVPFATNPRKAPNHA